ncbi:hypothetical protein DFX36_RS23650 [Vibrio parahaemolyticus]|nr:hypothetical protein [Vibrio parahaemolyticus]EJG0303426.1 hypothetical protein [Vibrio parahaemolyticus]
MSDIAKGVIIGVITTAILAFFSSLSGGWFIKLLGGVPLAEYKVLEQEVTSAHSRLNGLKLVATKKDVKEFGCGAGAVVEDTSLTVMYGSQDGTSCGVINKNYFKELHLNIPSK